jgi:tryptophan synthase alpha chain
LRRPRAGPIVVPYVLVDRARLPSLDATVRALARGGAAALELGYPFSDPIADGPVLEAAHDRALRNGTRWKDLLGACRVASATLPTAVMTYANPLFHRGLDRSFRELAGAGASGLIVPDLSYEDRGAFARAARRASLDLVLLGAPGVPPSRLSAIARASRGFFYLVSRYGTTGTSSGGSAIDLAPLVRTARRASPGLPILIGFGVRDRATATRALASGADGVIVGSAVEERLGKSGGAAGLERWLTTISSLDHAAPGAER